MRNTYRGRCNTCGIGVDPEEGHVQNEGGCWTTFCDDCNEEPVPVIRVVIENDFPFVRPEGFLGRERFGDYRTACADVGASYDRAREGNRISFMAIPKLIKELKSLGFAVSVADDVADAMAAQARKATATAATTADRIGKIQTALAEDGKALYPFQVDGVNWLSHRIGAILDDEMGLGKTVQALTALDSNAPVLVVAPAIAKGVWAREAAKWRPEFTTDILKGRQSFRWPKPGEIVITNYDILPKDKPTDPPAGTIMIADEAHALKNNKAQRTKRYRAMAATVREAGGRTWLLTGSPLLNRPPELWALMMAADIAREAFGDWDRFRILFNGKEGRFGIEWGTHPAPAASDFLKRVCLRRERRDVLPDLPTKTYREMTVDSLDGATKKLCKAALAALEAAGIDLDHAVNEAAFFSQRGPAFEEMSAARLALATAKIPAMLQIAAEHEEIDEPLVVFSAHRAPIDALAHRDGWAVITGDTAATERTRIENAFQAGTLKGIGGTIQAMGTALTLTKASQMLFVDLAWVPDLNAQAEDRCCRIGQDRGVQVTRLVADHKLDQMVSATLAGKQQLTNESIHASRIKPGEKLPDVVAILSEAATALQGATESTAAAGRRQAKNGRPAPPCAPVKAANRRGPIHPAEEWAAAALRKLAGNFLPDDAPLGDRLAEAAAGGLTDAQWDAARTLTKRYWDRVRAMPDENKPPF